MTAAGVEVGDERVRAERVDGRLIAPMARDVLRADPNVLE